MDPLLAAGTALAISLAVIPLMVRLAPRFGLLDQPNARKVHVHPIPRVGGWGIAIGAMAAIMLWLPVQPVSVAFVFGGLVFLVAGAADDMHDLRGRTKLILQAIAVVPVVVFGDLLIEVIPLWREWTLPYPVALAVSAVGLIACINATNTSDGLDGLAAGATLLSLFGILYLAFMAEAVGIMLMTAAALGGLVGFLRYNTHPAVIFMGDLGSQFLGFAVGFLALALLQIDPGVISPWALLLLIGLPTADIAVVAIRRLNAGVSLFRADQTHIHHRFLDLGFSHTQAVIIVYTLQGSFVFFGVALQDSEPWKIIMVYVLHLAIIYGFLYLAETSGSERAPAREESRGRRNGEPPRQALLWAPRIVLETLVPLVLVAGAIVASRVPLDFGILGALLLAVLLARQFSQRMQSVFATRIPVFLTTSAVLYLYTHYRPFASGLSLVTEFAAVGLLATLAFIAVRFSPKRRKEEFRTTSMDYLLVVFAVLAVIALRTIPSAVNPYFLVYLPIILYCSELLMVERRQRADWLPPAALAAAAIITVRGLLLGV
jgi:UDP-GlcNAc:undecaprenyl-phosphate/decaprenyl-phosphate GlcNAc-1-phosphate transferase